MDWFLGGELPMKIREMLSKEPITLKELQRKYEINKRKIDEMDVKT